MLDGDMILLEHLPDHIKVSIAEDTSHQFDDIIQGIELSDFRGAVEIGKQSIARVSLRRKVNFRDCRLAYLAGNSTLSDRHATGQSVRKT